MGPCVGDVSASAFGGVPGPYKLGNVAHRSPLLFLTLSFPVPVSLCLSTISILGLLFLSFSFLFIFLQTVQKIRSKETRVPDAPQDRKRAVRARYSRQYQGRDCQDRNYLLSDQCRRFRSSRPSEPAAVVQSLRRRRPRLVQATSGRRSAVPRIRDETEETTQAHSPYSESPRTPGVEGESPSSASPSPRTSIPVPIPCNQVY